MSGRPQGGPPGPSLRDGNVIGGQIPPPYAPQRSLRLLRVLQVEGVIHAADPHVLQAGHAPGLDPHQDLDAVPGPRGDLGGRHARVQPPGDPGVPQIVVSGRYWIVSCDN